MAKKLAKNNKLAVRDGFDVYLKQVSASPLLSREEELRLALKWFETRDREAGQKLALSNLRFVIKIAREYTKYGFKLPELVQEGNLGLLHSLEKFDPRKGYRLITYSVWWIRAYIQAYVLRSWSIVRAGTTRIQRKIFASLQKAKKQIGLVDASKPATSKQLAAALNITQDEFEGALSRIQSRDVSLDQPMKGDDDDRSYGDNIADENTNIEQKLIDQDLRQHVRDKLDAIYDDLKPRERFLLEHRLMSDAPMTLDAAGKEFGVTRERVRQIEERLKGKLIETFRPEAAI